MARTVNNTDLVPKEVFTELANLDKQLEETKQNLNDVLVPVVNLTNEFSKTSIKAKDFADALKLLQSHGGKIQGIYNEHDRLLREIERLKDKLSQSTSREAREVAILRDQLRQSNQELRIEAKEVNSVSNSIAAMRANVSRLKQEWANADVGSEKFKVLSKQLEEANAKLTEYERSVGIHTRNVGNYESGFSNLQYSVQQVARELPSLSIGLSQFFLAISNNIPILVDEINKAKQANASLAAEGKKGVPIFKQLASSIFSWQTALVVGVTLLTVYGKEIQNFINKLFDLRSAQDDLNASLSENGFGIGDEIAKIKDLQSRWNSLGNDMNAKKKFIEENKDAFHDLGVEISNVKDAENLLVNNTDKFILSLKLKAQASAAMKLASEEYEKAVKAQLKLENASSSKGVFDRFSLLFSGGTRGLQKDIDEYTSNGNKFMEMFRNFDEQSKQLMTDAGIKEYQGGKSSSTSTIDKIAEFRKRLAEKEARAVIDQKEFELKQGAELNKEIYKNEEETYIKRLDALNAYTSAMKASIKARGEGQKNDLIRGAAIGLGLNPDDEEDRKKASELVANQLILVEKKMAIELEKIDRNYNETAKDLWEDRVKRSVEASTMAMGQRLSGVNVEEMAESQALDEQFKKGFMLKGVYEAKKMAIEEKYSKKRLDVQQEELKKQLDIAGLSEEEKMKIREKIGDLELEEQKMLNERELMEEQKLYETKKQLAQEAYAFIDQLVQNSFANRLKAIEKEMEANEEMREEEIDRIDRFEEAGAISKEQADARKAAVDDKAKLREKELEEQKKEILRRQAIYEKAQAISSIGISTAVAIAQTAAQMGYPAALPFVAMVAAMGAIQTAAVLATPIPEYAEGTKDHPGGLAIVGDGGKSEMVIANGRIFKTPATDTLVELPRHAVVLPDFAAGMERELPNMDKPDRVISFEELSALLRDGNSKTDKIIKMLSRQAKNQIYERELNKVRRITR